MTTSKSIVAIDGIDGSGKTFFAERLRAAFAEAGIASAHISVDDFRRAVDFSRRDKSETDIYADEYYNFAEMSACLRAFLGGDSALTVPAFDSRAGRRVGERSIDAHDAEVLIVEGVFALRVPEVASAFLVYLTTSLETARARIVSRDIKKGRTIGEVNRRIDTRYFPSQARYQAEYRPHDRADLVVDNDDFAAPRITRATFARLGAEQTAALQTYLARTGAVWACGEPTT